MKVLMLPEGVQVDLTYFVSHWPLSNRGEEARGLCPAVLCQSPYLRKTLHMCPWAMERVMFNQKFTRTLVSINRRMDKY